MKSYSQQGEDLIVAEILKPEGRKSRVLDIGAWHATDKSNSRLFIECGWDALLIEPSPGPMRGLVEEYGRNCNVVLVQACVALDVGMVPLQATDDAVSTYAGSSTYEQWSGATRYFGTLFVPAITLHQIAQQFGGFEFVSIDAEGMSVDLCKRMLDLGHQPKAICCEYDDRLAELLKHAGENGYSVPERGVNGTNVILVRQ